MPGPTPSRYNVEYADFGDKKSYKAIYRKDLGPTANRLFIERGFNATVEQLNAVTHTSGVVYLDGACEGPYADPQRRVYSLDHHQGCIRQITRSTCEQAMLFTRGRVLEALGLKIIGNDPDLDTVFAGWAILNADSLAYDDHTFRRVLALFLLEGNIDGLGLGYEELTGLDAEKVNENRRRLRWLMQKELELKGEGRWSTIDFVDFTAESLDKLDRFAFYRDEFEVPVQLASQQSEALPNGQTVVCVRAENTGIYEVERELMKKNNPACVIYYDGKTKWTIKLTGLLSPFNLAPVWKALSQAEHAEKLRQNVTSDKLLKIGWGGADGIGGAPRYPNGQGPFLDSANILEIVVRELSLQIKS